MNIVNIGYHATNYYVLADSKPRLLLDAGWPGSLREMENSCNRMGVRLRDIPYQLVTHFHPDHAGLAQELKSMGIQLIVIDTQPSARACARNCSSSCPRAWPASRSWRLM